MQWETRKGMIRSWRRSRTLLACVCASLVLTGCPGEDDAPGQSADVENAGGEMGAYEGDGGREGTPPEAQAPDVEEDTLEEPAESSPAEDMDPEMARCQQGCEARARRMHDGCVEDGGDPGECGREARAWMATCLEEHCVEAGEVGPCERGCSERARRQHAACVDEGGNPEDCGREARHFARECVETHCSAERDDPDPCEARCGERVRRGYDACVDEGGAPEECEYAAERRMAECVETRCGEARDAPDACEEGCGERARHMHAGCVEEGGDPEECGRAAREWMQGCSEMHCEAEPDEQDACELACRERAHGRLEACVEEGGEHEDCAGAARAWLAECIDARCAEGMGEQAACEEGCGARARHVHAECLEGGGTPEECGREARGWLGACLERHCGEVEAEEEACERGCNERARHAHAECLEAGGDAEDCGRRARAWAAECVDRHCGEAAEAEDEACGRGCSERARHAHAECVEAGGEVEDCGREARAWAAECVERHCGEAEPEAREDQAREDDAREAEAAVCEDACGARAWQMFTTCVDSGRDAEVCGPFAREAMETCLAERCRPAQDEGGGAAEGEGGEGEACNAACGERARHFHANCLEEGGEPEACGGQAREWMRACIERHCGDAADPEEEARDGRDEAERDAGDVCEGACGDRARRMHAQCIEAGGTPEACGREAREWMAACIARHCAVDEARGR